MGIWLPDAAHILEPALLTPGGRFCGPVEVDWENKYPKSWKDYGSLKAGVFTFQYNVNMTCKANEKKAPATITGTPALSFSGLDVTLAITDYSFTLDNIETLSSEDVSSAGGQLYFAVATLHSWNSSSEIFYIFTGVMPGRFGHRMYIRGPNSDGPDFSLNWGAVIYRITSFAPQISKPYVYGFHIRSDGTARLFVGTPGAGVIFETPVTLPSTRGTSLIHDLHVPYYNPGAQIGLMYNDYNDYSDEEVNDLVKDPYQFLKPAGT